MRSVLAVFRARTVPDLEIRYFLHKRGPKRGKCARCGEPIEPGELYARLEGKVTPPLHVECFPQVERELLNDFRKV